MDNIEIKTTMLNNQSSKPDPDSPVEDTPVKDTPSNLSGGQIRLIVSTWKIVKGNVTLEDAGMILFKKLFEIAPELLGLFSFKDAINKDEGMRKHGLTVMETIDTAIGLLEDEKMSELTDTLIDLGIVHNMKQVQLESFAPVGAALVHTLGLGLNDKFTEEVQTAWITLYTIIQHFMTKGMKQGLDI